MKILTKINAIIFLMSVFFACDTDEDLLYSFDYIEAPTNVSATFDVSQDNSGLVNIVPNAEGAQQFTIDFGDGSESVTVKQGEMAPHTYAEGVYTVKIIAEGLNEKTTEFQQELNVTFKAPENLMLTISNNEQNPRIVTVSATADFVTVYDVYFGDVEDEEPTQMMPGETLTHTYAEPGDYEVRVVARSAGAATSEKTETVNVPEAADPINLPIDFESFTISYAFVDFGGVASQVIDNPDMNEDNASDKVAESHKTSGAEVWAGTLLQLENPIDFSTNTTFKVKVWSPKQAAVVKLKVENLSDGNISHEVDVTTTLSNQWEELSFNFSEIDKANEYQKVVIFFDFGNNGDDSRYYFDDIKLVPSVIPAFSLVQDFEGEAPTFTVFGNIADIEVVDNPASSEVNSTSKVAKLTKTANSETWAGAFFETASLDFDNYSKVKLKVYSPKSGIVVKVKLENADASITHEVDITNTKANEWEELTYDFSAAPDAEYVKVVVFFDFGKAGDDSVYYYDEIGLANDGASVADSPIQDFEDEAPTFTSFGNIANIEVINNPDANGINTSSKVAKMVKTANSETWAGMLFETATLDLDTYSKVKVKIWSPKSGAVVKLKFENADASTTHEVDLTNSTTNAWEELTYDFSAAPAADYVKVVLFFDFGNVGDDSIYYFDDFALTL